MSLTTLAWNTKSQVNVICKLIDLEGPLNVISHDKMMGQMRCSFRALNVCSLTSMQWPHPHWGSEYLATAPPLLKMGANNHFCPPVFATNYHRILPSLLWPARQIVYHRTVTTDSTIFGISVLDPPKVTFALAWNMLFATVDSLLQKCARMQLWAFEI